MPHAMTCREHALKPARYRRFSLRQHVPRALAAATLALAALVPHVNSARAAAWDEAPLACYAVPALSSVVRLPHTPPSDGQLSTELRLIAAKGEYEPVSFVITPRQDIARLELQATDLTGPGGTIPAANVDLKVVKVWWQGGTAWYSYFADNNRRELVPELLLNDETLVKVDLQKRENYLRVGDQYQWISYPQDKAEKYFNYLTEPVADARTLQPVTLKKGENKQIWITVLAPKDAKEGIYNGKVNLVADGKNIGAMTLSVRVLPFELPLPKTYYNINNDYLVTMYGTGIYDICQRLNIPLAEADRLQMAFYKDLLAHNIFNNRADLTLTGKKDRAAAMQALTHEIEMMKKAGFVMKPLISSGWAYWAGGEDKDSTMQQYKQRIDDLTKTLKEAVGHDDIYITSWDEAGVSRIKIMRPLLAYAHQKGLKIWLTTRWGEHFELEGYLIDYANHGGWPNKEFAEQWHAVGAKIASYAGPHTGPENPVVFRRYEGLNRYKANYDGSYNYQYYSALHSSLYERQKQNVWNDFEGDAFRRFNLVYPTKEGPIDTLAWEGFREGIDDVRYATKLKQEAAAAIASDNVQAGFVAKKALMWLELLDDKTADLNAVRIEMISRILQIQDAMNKKS